MIDFDELLLALNELESIVMVTNREGIIKYVNNAFEDKYGYTKEEVIGHTPQMIKSDYHDKPFYKQCWNTILNGDTWDGIFLNRTKSGRLIWEHAKISPIKKQGEIIGFIAIKEDVTYKKEYEEQFHQEKFLLDELFENAPVGVILFKPIYANEVLKDLIVIKANPIASNIFSQQEITEMTLKDFHPEYEKIYERVEQMLYYKQDFELYCSSNQKYLHMRTFPLDEDGFCMFVNDITDYKNNITALEKSEQRYTSLVEDSPALIRRFNKNGTISYVNNYYAKYYNSSAQQFIGQNLFQLLDKDELKHFREELNQLIPTNPIKEYEQQNILAENEVRWIRWTDRALFDTTGLVTEYQSVGMDFTQLKNIEIQLEEQKNKLNAIFNNAIIGIGVLNKKGEFLMTNSRLREMLQGSSTENNETFSYFDFISEENKHISHNSLNNLFEGVTKNLNVKNKYIRKDGSEFWAELFASPITFQDGKVKEVVGLVIDISFRHKMEEELKASEHKLKKLNHTKDKLFSVIAHDIRNPFNAILGFSNILNKNIDNLSVEEIKEFVSKIDEASEQTFKLLEDLLTWAKSQLGQLYATPIPLQPATLINECINSLQSLASEKNITISTSIFTTKEILADDQMFKFIIRNLLHNSIKFSHPNSDIQCLVIEKGTENINIIIKDNGVGIKPEKLKVLFNLDEFLSTSGTSLEKGTGLGLSLSKEMIEQNNGTIKVISEENKGSEFTITFPQNKKHH
jgi:PAS domain S-box-containing protein